MKADKTCLPKLRVYTCIIRVGWGPKGVLIYCENDL